MLFRSNVTGFIYVTVLLSYYKWYLPSLSNKGAAVLAIIGIVPAGKEETMQEKVANTTPTAPLKLDVSVRVIEPVKNLMGFASVKFNDCFVVENLKIVQGSKGLFLGMPSQPDGKGGYRDMAYPVTKEFREQLNTAVLQAYEAKLEQMAERGSVGRASISDQLKAGKAAAEQAKAERPPKEKSSRSAER